MNFSIVFDNSGDSLVFDALSFETYAVLEYYVNQLELSNNNRFTAKNCQLGKAVNNLDDCIKQANSFLLPILESTIETGDHEYYLDQRTLNKIHADWVNSQTDEYSILEKQKSDNEEVRILANRLHELFSDDLLIVTLGDVLTKLNLSEPYGNINRCLHKLESQFNEIRFSTESWHEFDNPYDKSLITNSISNFRLAFNHLGRTLYHKWKYFDTELEFNDENSFDQLLGFVDIGLGKPQTIDLSPEYLLWCKQKNKVPCGEFLNIGNILDLDKKLNECRIVLYRNIQSSNSFSIKLNKG